MPRCPRLAALLALGLTASALAGAQTAAPVTPPDQRRGTDQTFLTYPEWFLVHSPAEFADFTQRHNPSDFPFLGHIGQFWGSYRKVYQEVKRAEYPWNGGYHLMICVIGASTTLEYALRSAYETLIGRLSELTRTHGFTDEDRYAARVAQEYVDFIRVEPWYKFDFASRLHSLWRETSWTGPDLIRKWERKYILTSEYAAKGAYGWLLGKATGATYDPALPVTAVVVDREPRPLGLRMPDPKLLARFPDGSALLALPRYEPFQLYARTLAQQGLVFREIAGNRTVILVTLLVPTGWRDTDRERRVLFTQPILTQSGRQRVALIVPVNRLAKAFGDFAQPGVSLEHVYDY
jgi:hypothetical protein